jgi:hypothetical protein
VARERLSTRAARSQRGHDNQRNLGDSFGMRIVSGATRVEEEALASPWEPRG